MPKCWKELEAAFVTTPSGPQQVQSVCSGNHGRGCPRHLCRTATGPRAHACPGGRGAYLVRRPHRHRASSRRAVARTRPGTLSSSGSMSAVRARPRPQPGVSQRAARAAAGRRAAASVRGARSSRGRRGRLAHGGDSSGTSGLRAGIINFHTSAPHPLPPPRTAPRGHSLPPPGCRWEGGVLAPLGREGGGGGGVRVFQLGGLKTWRSGGPFLSWTPWGPSAL